MDTNALQVYVSPLDFVNWNAMGIAICIVVILMCLSLTIKFILSNIMNKDSASNFSVKQEIIQKNTLKSGQQINTFEQDGIYYKPYFDKEKGLYIPIVVTDISAKTNPLGVTQKNIIYYQLIPLEVLNNIYNHFAEKINEALMKNNKENNNKEDNKENNNG